MSDFDKEAEREKLRQQYETDKEERKSTQRMSELLLQGATMTGKHCDTCGDPIFRYDGNEFCSTCQQAESEAANAESNGSEPTTETAGQDASEIEIESTEPDRPQQNQAQQPSQSQQSNQAGSRPSHPTPQQTPPHQSRRAPPSQAGENEYAEQPRQPEPRTATRTNNGAGDLTEARNTLVRKLTTLTREAESTDDVGYSRELLAATREAAEAIAALDRANR